VVENRGEEPFAISTGMDSRGVSRSVRFRVSAVHEDGGEAADPGVRGMFMGGIGRSTEVPPGGELAEEVLLPLYRRIDRPGPWTIGVRHDLGWKDAPGRPVPAPEMRLRFREPTEEEARRILERTLAPQDAGSRFAGVYSRPWNEPSALALPRYFPLVAASAREGNVRALDAATWFSDTKATRLLIECLPLVHGDDFERIAYCLGCRLPLPPGESIHPFPGRDRKPAVPWDASLDPDLRSWAIRELEAGDPARIGIAGMYLRCLPAKSDAPTLKTALDRRLAGTPAGEGEGAGALPEGAYSLFEAWRAAGGVQDFPPRGPADALGFIEDLRLAEVLRPPGWEGALASLLSDPQPWIRAAAVEGCPEPVPTAVRERIPSLLGDPASRVRSGACRLAAVAKDPALSSALVDLLGRELETDVVEEAFRWVCRAGARLSASRVLVSRMDPARQGWSPHLGTTALARLAAAWVEELEDCGYSERVDPVPAETWTAIRGRWKVFLEGRGASLSPRERLRLGDPAVVPEMFAPAISFSVGGRDGWPPFKER